MPWQGGLTIVVELMTTQKPHLYAIDGSGFIFRAFHALPPLTRPDGTQVNAVYGFCTMLMKVLGELDASHLVVVFDKGRENFRHKIYPEYKANRGETPEELIPQFEIIHEACQAFGVPLVAQEGVEADDVLATLAARREKEGYDLCIVSSDKDLMQLVQPGVDLYDPMKNRVIDQEGVAEKFGVKPEQVVDVQSLCGDSTDNIPGVPGIGIKTASVLIQEFGTLENLLENTDQVPQKKRRELLEEHRDMAVLSKKLVQLDQQVSLSSTLKDFVRQDIDSKKIVPFLRAQNFRKLEGRLSDLGVAGLENRAAVKVEYSCIQSTEDLKDWVSKIKEAGQVAVDTETDSLNPMRAELVGISLSVKPGEAAYIPIGHQKAGTADLFASSTLVDGQLPLAEVQEHLGPVLSNSKIVKIGQNIKFDLHVLAKAGFEVKTIQDTMVMSCLIDGHRHGHGMDELALLHLDHKTTSFSEVVGKGKHALKSFAEVDLETATHYAAEDADITLQLYNVLAPRLKEAGLETLYNEIERPLIETLFHMEQKGIRLDRDVLRHLSNEFLQQMQEKEKQIYALAGQAFNIGSPKQMGEILFEKLKLPGGRRGKSGAYSTSADVLENLAGEGHEIAQEILAWRAVSKLRSTYTQSLIDQINPETDRVHTSFSQTITLTGRLSSSEPNLQNIPIRRLEGKRIREAFVPQNGWQLYSLDYSQIELRLLAHVAEIEVLQRAFHEGADIHALTASQAMGIPIEEVTSEQRSMAKTINFGIIYGISAYGLAQQTSISQKEAAVYIEKYFEQYPGIKAYMENYKERAREHGYVETLMGRKIYLPDIQSKNPMLRNFAERQAINAPLQGTAADLIKKAMNQVDEELRASKVQTRLLLQVHDELVLEAPPEEETVIKKVQDIMQTVMPLSVPLEVAVGVGPNWAQAH